MKKLMIVLALAGLLISCGSGNERSKNNDSATLYPPAVLKDSGRGNGDVVPTKPDTNAVHNSKYGAGDTSANPANGQNTGIIPDTTPKKKAIKKQ